MFKSVSVEVSKPQSDLSAKTTTEMVAKEPSSEAVLQTIKQEEDASSRLSSTGCTIINSQLAKDCSETSSQNQGPSDSHISLCSLNQRPITFRCSC